MKASLLAMFLIVVSMSVNAAPSCPRFDYLELKEMSDTELQVELCILHRGATNNTFRSSELVIYQLNLCLAERHRVMNMLFKRGVAKVASELIDRCNK